jgi:hypothetical protein
LTSIATKDHHIFTDVNQKNYRLSQPIFLKIVI